MIFRFQGETVLFPELKLPRGAVSFDAAEQAAENSLRFLSLERIRAKHKFLSGTYFCVVCSSALTA
jgi:hypothetical protein